jgi:hypothetical protein
MRELWGIPSNCQLPRVPPLCVYCSGAAGRQPVDQGPALVVAEGEAPSDRRHSAICACQLRNPGRAIPNAVCASPTISSDCGGKAR